MAIGRADFKGKGSEMARAARVIVSLGGKSATLTDVNVLVDSDAGMVQIISRDGNEHLVSAPITATYIEWGDTTEIRTAPESSARGADQP